MKYQILNNCEGQTLALDIIDDNGMLILKKGTVINERLIKRLKNFGMYCLAIEHPISDNINTEQPLSQKTIIEACSVFNETTKEINVDKAFRVASKIVDELCANAAILGNGYEFFKEYDENTALHSINVAILSTMFGINLGLPMRKLNNLSIGGLLHDIGKSRVPIEIINKVSKLTDEEISEIRKHPQYGRDILGADVLIPATVKAIAYQHHENWDGTGYPRGLKEYEVYELAAIVHICDVFDALIAKRSYKEAFTFKDTIEYMKSESGKMFSPYYLKYFFRYVPIFHVATDVILSNGEKALVVKNNYGDMTRPILRLYKDMSEVNLMERLDLEIIS